MSMVFTRGHAKVLDVQERKLWRQARNQMFFRKFTGYTQPSAHETMRGALQPNFPAGKIVQLIDGNRFGWHGGDTRKGGGDHYVIEVMNAITGMGVSGDAQVKGEGTVVTTKQIDFYLNRKRKETIVKLGNMHELRGGAWAIEAAKTRGPELMDWYQRWMSFYGITWSMVRQYSWHVEGNHENGDYNIGGSHHPNFYIAGAETGTNGTGPYPTWSATDATYEQNIARHMLSVANDAPAAAMSFNLLTNLATECNEKRLQPAMLEGGPGYVMILHNDQWNQLLADPQFLDYVLKTGTSKSEQMDVIKYNRQAICQNFHIYAGNFAALEVHPHKGDADWSTAVTSANATAIDYGLIDEDLESDAKHRIKLDHTDPDNIRTGFTGSQSGNTMHANQQHWRGGMILGANALIGMQAQKPKFFRDDDDYENKKTMDIDGIESYARVDHVDSVSSPTEIANTSSIFFVTNSRRNLALAA